jgi:nucleoside-triphosphatase THEP1
MTGATNRIAAVRGSDCATVQALFQHMVEHWRAFGVQIVGLIEKMHGLAGRTCNAGVLHDIATGSPYPIFREAVLRSDACHIDVTGAEIASKAVLPQIGTCDLVILSKFGKLEAAKRGLIGAFEAAMRLGKPVLTTVLDRHLQAWREFAPDASALEARPDALTEWWTLIGSNSPPKPPAGNPGQFTHNNGRVPPDAAQ